MVNLYRQITVATLSLLSTSFCTADDEALTNTAPGAILTGIDVLEQDEFRPLDGRTIGLITNHTGVSRSNVSTVKLLHDAPNVQLQVLFSPEHGFEGTLDQKVIGNSSETETGLQIVSLYGATRTPSPENLAGLDALVFDIQDIGTRFYTYISTMGNAMQAAADAGIEFVVLDRPNPVNGLTVSGPVRDEGLQSFVAFHDISVQHGMTVGELARMIRDENELDLNLRVVAMQGWKRDTYYDGTGLLWINPSPNMRSLNQALLYPGVGLLEATNISVGRGTDTPFEVLGAPWIEPREFASALNDAQLPGVAFVPIQFRPDSSKHANTICGGVNIIITNRADLDAVRTGLTIAVTLRRLFPDDWDTTSLNRLLADDAVDNAIVAGSDVDAIQRLYATELEQFRNRRLQFLLY